MGRRDSYALGKYQRKVDESLEAIRKKKLVPRISAKDPKVWKAGEAHAKVIANRLGWLRVTETMVGRCGEIDSFVEEVRRAGYREAVLLGMGGSSLCPEVCAETFGVADGFLRVRVLDSTDPATISAVERSVDLAKTIFIVSSKSGTTTETSCFHKYFYEKLRAINPAKAGEHFVAITDPGTSLEREGRQQSFRRVFLNPADIGGRYSALSYFGLVPAALLGIDIGKLLERAEEMKRACAEATSSENPGAMLGVALGELAKAGRDKLTFFLSPSIQSFGSWVEQLVAESTGKENTGILPVAGELLPSPHGKDRVFVYLQLGEGEAEIISRLKKLQQAGHPVITLQVSDKYDLGDLFFRWEFATAIAGALLKINPFDEPNVKESKDNTNALLTEYLREGKLDSRQAAAHEGELSLFFDRKTLKGAKAKSSLREYLSALLKSKRTGDYVAITAYVQPSESNDRVLRGIRRSIGEKTKLATTLGYGPRYLHSTGQFHKGGPNSGIFLQITADDRYDLPIPDERYTFGVLKRAQALGDYQALVEHKRRVVNINLGKDVEAGLERLRGVVGRVE